jgi:lysophospholipid hydrolase|tara:strand:+ start:5636 stop:9181 length:3546 start_codon:yes stop_codon:yes gene_type:complete
MARDGGVAGAGRGRRAARAMGYAASAVATACAVKKAWDVAFARDDGGDAAEEATTTTTTTTTTTGGRNRRGVRVDGGDSAEVLRVGSFGSRESQRGMSSSTSREDEFWSDEGDLEGSRTSGQFFASASGEDVNDENTPNFFASTKFFSVLELELSRELFEASEEEVLAPNEVLFRQGDDSSSGIYVVVEGSVGVYLQPTNGAPPVMTNILQEGESVGDIDILDSARRSVSCITMQGGAKVVRVSQRIFLDFVRKHPHTLQLYLQQAIARLWRVAQFSLIDFLGMPRQSLRGQPEADDACSLANSDFLEHLPTVEKYCARKQIKKGEIIFAEGDSTDAFYILLKGSIAREAIPWPKGDGLRGKPVRALQLIGSAHFMTRSLFRETQQADEDCEMLVITGEVLEHLCTAETEAYISLLRQTSSSLGVLIRNFIGFGLNRVWLRSGDHVFMTNEDATSMFVIISGRVRLRFPRHTSSGDEIIRERGRGDTIGEAPLLAHGKYSSTAVTSRDTELVRMSHGALKLINAHHSEVSSRLLELVACKLQNNLRTGDRSLAELVTICLIPAGPRTQINEFASALQSALSMFGSTLLLTSSVIDEIFADETTHRLDNLFYRSKLTGWMAEQEEVHRFIVLQADPRASSWSKVCASQADCVLVVAHGNHENKMPLLYEQRLLWRTRNSARPELVLIHEPGSTPSQTKTWQENRTTIKRHHHVRLASRDDMSRLARYVSGHSVGVILTGGGGGGLAHLGALRALEENGIPIDCIGGTSQGTLTAGMYARTLSTSHILPMLRNNMHVLNSPHHLLTDLTLPLLSLFSGKGLDTIIKSSVGADTSIEDLWLNFFCCSTNLNKQCLNVHTSGRLWRCIRASMTVLGLLPPVRDENGELLVDGGYLNSVPVDVMRKEMGVETVIVVDVEDKDFISFRDLTPHDGGMSSFGLLWDRLNPFDSRKSKSASERLDHPSYADVLNALTATTTKKHLELVARDHRINMHLRPPGVSSWMAHGLTLSQMDAAVRKAQAYTNTAITNWKHKAKEERRISDVDVNKPHAELQMAASAFAAVSDPESPNISPHVSPRNSFDRNRVSPHRSPRTSGSKSTSLPKPPNMRVNVVTERASDSMKQRTTRKSGATPRAALLPSNDPAETASTLSPRPGSQLVRTFTDHSQSDAPLAIDPALFMSTQSQN